MFNPPHSFFEIKLFKFANVDYNIPEDEYYDPSNSLTVNFFNNLNSSSNNIEKLKSNVINRVAKGEEALPLRLVLKEDDNETKAKTDEIISNLGDKVGGKQDFIEIYSDNNSSYYRQATCRLVRKVDTAFGERYLVIYEEDGLKTHPSDEEYEKIADLFLQGGLNNDIYDKITNVFGSEWGYYNQTFLKSISDKSSEDIPLLKKSNTITLFYTDLANAGDSKQYISSSYIPSDLESSDSSPYSNERLMIHVHAPKATGDYFSESIISLACEFEKLIYDQYFSESLSKYCYSEQLDKFGFERPSDKSGFSDYFFSFLAKVIAANTLRDKNYSVPASYNLFSLEDKSFTNLFGLDKYYLYGMDKFDIGSLNLLAQEGDDFQTIAKAVISSFAYYIYTNFGSGFIREYTLGSKAGLDGIVSAINKVYETSYTLSDLLSSWSIATLNSSKQSKTRPYTFNYLNYFKVQGVQYPNIDFSNTQAYKATEKGVPSSLATTILNNSSACYKVKDSWQGEYEAVAPSLEEGLELRVIRKQVN